MIIKMMTSELCHPVRMMRNFFHRRQKMVVLGAHWLKGYRARTLKISHVEAKNAGWKMIFPLQLGDF